MSGIDFETKLYFNPKPILIISAFQNEKPLDDLAIWIELNNKKDVSINIASKRLALKGTYSDRLSISKADEKDLDF